MYKQLLLNVLIIISPIYLSYILLMDRSYQMNSKRTQYYLGFFAGIATIFCMSFPIVSGDNGERFLWDLRWIPFLISLLYGGYSGGFLTFIILIVYRLYLGGGLAFYTVLLDGIFLLTIIPLLHRTYITCNRKSKILLGITFSILTYIVVMGSICFYWYYIGKLNYIFSKHISLYFFMGCCYIISTILSILLIEKIIRNDTSRKQSHQLVDNSIEPIAIIYNKQWIYMNPAGLQLFEVAQEELIGKTVISFLHPKHHNDFHQEYAKVVMGEVLGPKEFEWISDKGNLLYTEMVLMPYKQDDKLGIQVILRDISERKRAEQLMLQSEKLSVAGQLAAGIAHEIRNPITAIKGFIHLLQSNSRDNKHYYKIIGDEMDRIELILSELLVLAKPQVVRYERKNIVSIIDDVSALLNTQAIMKNIEIVHLIPSKDLWLLCDENQLKQVFINFIKNAIEVMDKGGSIILNVKEIDNQVEIEIKDEGHGIPKELLERIGTPFYSTKENGTGLGLAVSFRIIESHKGQIQVTSELGKGTTFFITLPLA